MNYIKLLLIILLISYYNPGYSQPVKSNVALGFTESYYVPAVGGTRLAVDVHFPKGYKNSKLPALLELTRYWRSTEDPETGEPTPSLRERDNHFLANNYILVKIDARGTGASYGRRPGEYTPIEVKDAKYIVDWVVNQSWSDGSVGAYGTSYSGTTAELLCATRHEAVKAVIPGWSDFDVYESPGKPYGTLSSGFTAEWSKVVNWLDNNVSDVLKLSVRRVKDSFPHDAIAEHKNNPDVLEQSRNSKYKDSKWIGEFTHEECSPIFWKKEISASKVPMLVLTSWMDAGTAEGTLLRFNNFSNPQKIVLMPTSHGGKAHASPYVVSDKIVDPVPSVNEQLKLQLDFFDHYLKNKDNGVNNWPNIKYYNLGEEEFKYSNTWPPEGQSRFKYYLASKHKLIASPPAEHNGKDEYKVDFSVSTGINNRWHTQMGKPVLNLDNRNTMDSLMLTYTTKPLDEDLQITGTPIMTLYLSSSHKDGVIYVYLEDVDPNGTSRYITEGGLHFEHRKLSDNPMAEHVPYHTFYQADASPMPVNKIEEISFKLWPTSVLIKKGHSIRIAIAGTDKDTFDRVPMEGTPIYKIYRNLAYSSFIDLPIIN